MEPIQEYRIIQAKDLGSLADEVNAALKEGWQPHGAPGLYRRGTAVAGCCQATVKFRELTGGEKIAARRRR
jgi:hypothetical protein